MSETAKAQFSDSALAIFYPLAVVLGVLCGLLHIYVGDPLLTALAVVVCTMGLGLARPRQPWRWVALVGLPVPITMAVAHLFDPLLHFTRAALAGSVLVILPGVAGAYGGYFMRKMITDVFFTEKK